MKKLIYFLFCIIALPVYAQEDTELYDDPDAPKENTFEKHMEIGADVHFSGGTMGSAGGLGLKLAFVQNEYVAFGPCIRYNYTRYKNNGLTGSTAVYGGGAFVHARFFNYLYAGLDFEVLKTPFINGIVATGPKQWIPVAQLGGGFSHAFGENQFFRLQAGVLYDILNNPNSPLRYGYFMRKENGTLIPVMYRITFFFTI